MKVGRRLARRVAAKRKWRRRGSGRGSIWEELPGGAGGRNAGAHWGGCAAEKGWGAAEEGRAGGRRTAGCARRRKGVQRMAGPTVKWLSRRPVGVRKPDLGWLFSSRRGARKLSLAY